MLSAPDIGLHIEPDALWLAMLEFVGAYVHFEDKISN
jgi:hypothetical protein